MERAGFLACALLKGWKMHPFNTAHSTSVVLHRGY